MNDAPIEGDCAADAEVGPKQVLARGFRTFARYPIVLRRPDGETDRYERDVCLAGSVIGVIPLDLARGEIVLLRQFRVAAHLATGKGELVELVAGRVDSGETSLAAARRECREEIGLDPQEIVELFRYMPAPGVTDEIMTFYVASVDAAELPKSTGLAQENEWLRPFRLRLDDALDLLQRGVVCSGPLILGLHWLALNRARLGDALNPAA